MNLSIGEGLPDDLRAWQKNFRNALIKALGVDPENRPSVECEVISERELEGFVRQYVRLHCANGLIFPAYLLRPTSCNEAVRVPGLLALHGHGPGKVVPAGFGMDATGNSVQIVGERDYAVQAVRRGYVALAPDQMGFGELMFREDLVAKRSSSCDQFSMRCLMAGTTAIGQRVLQSMICLDFLCMLPEVDGSRLIVMGQSGGGTTSLFTGAVDERVWATVPSCYFCTFHHSILAMYHCTCNYVPGLLEVGEMYDVAALIAPRLLYVIAGREDPIFPIEGVEIAYAKTKEVYQALGAISNLGLYVGPEGHRFYAAEVWDWLAQRL
jgi:dienelactone hydrolase